MVIAPLVITFIPGNPNFKDWIKSEISILHEDPSLKKLFQEISVVKRQNLNIKRRIMRNKYTRNEENPNPALPPPGNYRHHDPARCVCCARMEDELKKVKISKTGREYTVKRHYTCLSTRVEYLVTCDICSGANHQGDEEASLWPQR